MTGRLLTVNRFFWRCREPRTEGFLACRGSRLGFGFGLCPARVVETILARAALAARNKCTVTAIPVLGPNQYSVPEFLRASFRGWMPALSHQERVRAHGYDHAHVGQTCSAAIHGWRPARTNRPAGERPRRGSARWRYASSSSHRAVENLILIGRQDPGGRSQGTCVLWRAIPYRAAPRQPGQGHRCFRIRPRHR